MPHYLFVGNTANCDYGDIQSAINNVVCPGTIVTQTAHGYTSKALLISDKSPAVVGAGTGVGCGTPSESALAGERGILRISRCKGRRGDHIILRPLQVTRDRC